MSAYYNEIDPYAAQWLRNLIAKGRIAPGDVDERSIVDVQPDDLNGYTQCHFFAGIGGWSLALRLAGWSDNSPVWTGSCPCQPFSVAGKQKGVTDERHLWPEFYRLIKKCGPPTVFGEQVASKSGRAWLDVVRAEMEALAYGFGAVDLCAAGVGAPHIRQRLWFVAERLADARSKGLSQRVSNRRIQSETMGAQSGKTAKRRSNIGRLADSDSAGSQSGRKATETTRQRNSANSNGGDSGTGPTNNQWRNADWLSCRDGKWRSVEPGTFPLAYGISNRVGRLRAYGNAIVPQVAAEVIKASLGEV